MNSEFFKNLTFWQHLWALGSIKL